MTVGEPSPLRAPGDPIFGCRGTELSLTPARTRSHRESNGAWVYVAVSREGFGGFPNCEILPPTSLHPRHLLRHAVAQTILSLAFSPSPSFSHLSIFSLLSSHRLLSVSLFLPLPLPLPPLALAHSLPLSFRPRLLPFFTSLSLSLTFLSLSLPLSQSPFTPNPGGSPTLVTMATAWAQP